MAGKPRQIPRTCDPHLGEESRAARVDQVIGDGGKLAFQKRRICVEKANEMPKQILKDSTGPDQPGAQLQQMLPSRAPWWRPAPLRLPGSAVITARPSWW